MGTTKMAALAGAAALVLCVLSCRVSAQAPAAAPGPAGAGTDCFAALANVSDCLTYVEEGSKLKKPDKGCCPEFGGLVDSNPICLCQLLAKPEFGGIKLDLNKALKLPSACGVSTPPLSTCSAVGVPVSLPPSSEDSTAPSLSPAMAPADAGTSASAPGPAGPGSDCFTALTNMSDCLTYVEEGSKLKKPDKGCCPELAGLVDSNPICLCQLLSKPSFAGVKLDLSKALKLPSVCSVTTPPVSTCAAIGIPVSLPPSATPSGQPGSSNLAPSMGSPEGSMNSPSEVAPASPSGNEAISIKFSAVPFIFGLATAFVSIFF
ncbi:xylogen-like protein 11 [Senna tora]|uniref:Xylogen-like protein 11 n=1 Tax=Senna tora TaxID=362788 RepID=A0A834U0F1_9FABA|nr:xylogen-like protein 11 [Senna tora]